LIALWADKHRVEYKSHLTIERPLYSSVSFLASSYTACTSSFADYVARRSGLEALLVILPQQMDDESRAKLRDFEQQLLGMAVSIPVYFTQETPDLKAAVSGFALTFQP
jgi:hypothetical protein